ncbi:MAG: mandelate racemase/muconate lactonizing enzyme family protein [Terriglobia bacterium]
MPAESISRRLFLGGMLSPLVAGIHSLQALAAPPMKITKIETVYWKSSQDAPWLPNWTWIKIHTDTGHSGIGETYPRSEAEAALVHSTVARLLLGHDPRDIDRIWAELYFTFDFQIIGGTEMRVLSAIDLALWDLLGKSLSMPVYRLIGGMSNSQIRVYNTCFPQRYDFLKDPEKIVRELIDGYGIKAIKIWPFDEAARRTKRQYITQSDIEEALAPVRKLRDVFGFDIEILMEFHSNWNLPSAIRIARALEPYKPMWLEDMLMPGQFSQYRQLAEATSIPLTISERMAGRMQYIQLLESRAAKYVMFDVCWCGGISEARKIASMAEAFQLPIAPHTAGGPLLFYASTHLSTAATNVAIQESVQRYYETDWPKMLENPIIPKNGTVSAPDLPGFGMLIKPEVWDHPAAIRRTSTL